jgi:hypothetical protein
MATKTPNAVAAKWASRLAGSTTDIKAGIQAVTVPPGQLAARAKTTWAANVAAAKTKFAANVGAVSLASWQQDAITKGLPRIATGAQAAQPKMAAVMSTLLPFITRLKGTLPPRGTTQQNIARAVAFMTGMTAYKKQSPTG